MIIGTVFFLFGAAALAVVISMTANWLSCKDSYAEFDAVITDVTKTYSGHGSNKKSHYEVTVEYDYNGKHYERELGYYTAGMGEGETVTILCNPDHPREIISSPLIPGAILSVFALIFGGIGAGFLMHEIKMKRVVQRLMDNEQYVCADYVREEPSGMRVNNVRYEQAVFCYVDQYGRKYEFASQPYHPLKKPFYPGQQVRVYVDMEKDARKYYIPEEQ